MYIPPVIALDTILSYTCTYGAQFSLPIEHSLQSCPADTMYMKFGK